MESAPLECRPATVDHCEKRKEVLAHKPIEEGESIGAMSKGKARHVEPIYTSIGCNRYSNVADVRSDGLVAFGAGKLVALWHSEVGHFHEDP